MNGTAAPTKYPWQLYDVHADALVWKSPVIIGDNPDLRAMVSETLYSIARTPFGDEHSTIEMLHREHRRALLGLLSYMSGYTRGNRTTDGAA